MKPEQLEIDRLRKEVAKLKAERDILKRPQPSSRGKRYEVRFHCEAPEHLAGTWLCDALDVSRSGFHGWFNRSPSARSRHDEVLLGVIDRIFGGAVTAPMVSEERIAVLLQESLAIAVKTDAMKPADTRRVIFDTMVQPKNVMFPMSINQDAPTIASPDTWLRNRPIETHRPNRHNTDHI